MRLKPRPWRRAPRLTPAVPSSPRLNPPWRRAPQARRVPELEESVRQLEASLCTAEDELHAVRAARQEV